MEKVEKLLPEVDIFRYIYYRLKNKAEDDISALTRDLSEEINIYIDQKIKKGELVAICIRGEPGTGKSVVGLEIKRLVNKKIKEYKNKEIDEYKWIASDQIEFLRLTKTKEEDVCMLIDEYSSLARTGTNATTEIAEFEYFSDVCRIQYIHRVMCSPITILDKNALLILDVMGNNKEKKLTQVRVTYNNRIEATARVLGSAWIDVSETLKSDWYRRYEIKKKMRANLTRDAGVRDVRELEFACVAIECIKFFKTLATKEKVELPIIRTKIMNIVRAKGQLISYYAEDEIAKPCVAILHTIHKNSKSKTPETREIYKEVVEDAYKDLLLKSKVLEKYRNIE